MRRNTVLFVDDKQSVLRLIKKMLQRYEASFDAVYKRSAADALEFLSTTSIDMIVADLRMPEMDGLQLLEKVKQQYPALPRLLLSNQENLILRSIAMGSIHQYFSKKKIKSKEFVTSIAQVLALKDLLGQKELLALITKMDKLPSLPAIYQELMESLQQPDSSLAQVGNIISKDLAMTAKILQLVNSSFYGINTVVDDLSLAVNLLGMETIKGLVLNIHIFSNVSQKESAAFGLDKLWIHSTNTARIARMLAKEEGLDRRITEVAYIGGLLHDVGKVILATCFGAIYKEIVNAAVFEKRALNLVEDEILHANHTTVGAYLLSLWGLPDQIVESVIYHHEPSSSPSDEFDAITLVHVANMLEASYDRPGAGKEASFDQVYLDRIGMTSRIPVWTKLTEQLLSEQSASSTVKS